MLTKKYLPVLAAFLVGIVGAAGYAVHAQTASPATSIPVATGSSIGDGDGETADDAQAQTTAQDPQHVDGETNDDQFATAPEVENGPGDTGSDAGESETGN